MLVGVNQLARLDLLAKHLDGAAPADRAAVGMAHRQLPGERLEARPLHLVEVADGAIHDRPHAADCPHDRAVHFA